MTENMPAVDRRTEVINIEDYAMPAERMQQQVQMIQQVMRQIMKDGEHYGKIPGCGDKPTLLKPGAEKLSTTFRLAPEYKITRTDMENGHREYEVVTTLTHIPSGQTIGQGVGSCSTMEAKYRYRKANQKCPECGKEETIIKGKKEFGGGWVCFQKKGGCGAKFKDGDERIENQNLGRVEYDNPADYYNTVLKMAKKRSHVDAILTATAASDIFTQDIEDLPDAAGKPGQKADPAPGKKPESEQGQSQDQGQNGNGQQGSEYKQKGLSEIESEIEYLETNDPDGLNEAMMALNYSNIPAGRTKKVEVLEKYHELTQAA